MTQYATDFSNYDISTTPYDWTERWNSGGTYEVSSSDLGNILKITATVDNRRAFTWDRIDDDPDRSDVEILFLYRFLNTVGQNIATAIVRGAGDIGSETAYRLGSQPNFYSIAEYVSGTFTSHVNDPYSSSQDTWYWIRVRAVGSDLSVKRWTLGEPEPEEWDSQFSDSSIADSGWVGILAYNGSIDLEISFFSVGTNGDKAPDTLLSDTEVKSDTDVTSPFIIRKPWKTQPAYPHINRHIIGPDSAVYDFSAGRLTNFGLSRYAISNADPSDDLPITAYAGRAGGLRGMDFTGHSGGIDFRTDVDIPVADQFTVFALFKTDYSNGAQVILHVEETGGGDPGFEGIQYSGSENQIYYQYRGENGDSWPGVPGVFPPDNTWVFAVGTRAKDGSDVVTKIACVDLSTGITYSDTNSFTAPNFDQRTRITLGYGVVDSNPLETSAAFIGFENGRAWSDAQIQSLYQNPWQIFEPRKVVIPPQRKGVVEYLKESQDDFVAANGTELSASDPRWVAETGQAQIIDNKATGNTNAATSLYRLEGVWPNNQFAEAVIDDPLAGGGTAGVALRVQSGEFSAYTFEIGDSSGPKLFVSRYVNGSYTAMVSTVSVPQVVAGSILRAEILGNVWTVYVDGEQVASGSDSTFSKGSVGVSFYDNNQNSLLRSFNGGSLGDLYNQQGPTANPVIQRVRNKPSWTYVGDASTGSGSSETGYNFVHGLDVKPGDLVFIGAHTNSLGVIPINSTNYQGALNYLLRNYEQSGQTQVHSVVWTQVPDAGFPDTLSVQFSASTSRSSIVIVVYRPQAGHVVKLYSQSPLIVFETADGAKDPLPQLPRMIDGSLFFGFFAVDRDFAPTQGVDYPGYRSSHNPLSTQSQTLFHKELKSVERPPNVEGSRGDTAWAGSALFVAEKPIILPPNEEEYDQIMARKPGVKLP